MFLTALSTPLPPYRLVPIPQLQRLVNPGGRPLATADRYISSVNRSTSTVGFPLRSTICLALTDFTLHSLAAAAAAEHLTRRAPRDFLALGISAAAESWELWRGLEEMKGLSKRVFAAVAREAGAEAEAIAGF
ncbi:hypothetical protein NL676_013796 [Syzygium grande]|nr:hypothetical protein NL676_013796 [Syzygium grande]